MTDPRTSAAQHRTGVALCALSAAGFGAMAVLGRLATDAGANVVSTLSLRFTIAAVVLWALVALTGRPVPRGRALATGLALGALYALEAALFFYALGRIDVALTELLLFTYPGIVVLAAVMLRRDKLDGMRAAALVLALGGVGLVLAGAGGAAIDGTGVALALGAALLYATYILTSHGVMRSQEPLGLSAGVVSGAALTTALAGIAGGGMSLHFGAAGWGWIAALALVSTVLPIGTFLAGMAVVGPSTASIVSALEPALAVGLAVVVLGERMTPPQLAGGLLVLAAVVLVQLRPATVRVDGIAAQPARRPAARALAQQPA